MAHDAMQLSYDKRITPLSIRLGIHVTEFFTYHIDRFFGEGRGELREEELERSVLLHLCIRMTYAT